MSRRAFLLLLASMVSLGAARGATINDVISPVSLVLSDAGARTVTTLEGRPVYYCGLKPFATWAGPLVGQPVSSTPDSGITVSVDGRGVALTDLLVRNGWLQPVVLSDDAQAAMTEGRGGWSCATAETPFDLMHTSVDPKILAAIALNESGLNGRAWPWTLNVAGQGYFFRTREDAYGAIKVLLAAHRCDFDVGIMQINYCWHGARFASPWEALSPATNIHVAEAILNENYSRTHSVARAIAWYHSANPVPGRAYLARFAHHLSQIQAGL